MRGAAGETKCQDCELDKPELGTWPPYAFALLLIYFLQQMNNPVLPVLHEMVVPKPGLSEEIVHSAPPNEQRVLFSFFGKFLLISGFIVDSCITMSGAVKASGSVKFAKSL
uniref:Uncharacterized protein n=1 Tax=Timema tahoe TaxID=61484 RepID=A0A7R9NZ20_9NEOP|nr:unnamed protein product [Timema tahoe]